MTNTCNIIERGIVNNIEKVWQCPTRSEMFTDTFFAISHALLLLMLIFYIIKSENSLS
jgi:hypothetical protein